MPTNVTPEYREAEQAFRRARDDPERLACLKQMLSTIPKHKGTEHLQADIKTRIKQLTEDLAGGKKGAGRKGPSYSVRAEGAAQVALLGAPNAGKSSLHAALTGAQTDIGPFPFTTKAPVPGMLPMEDLHIQLVDLPPISRDYVPPWLTTTLQTAHAALLVIDMSDPACIDHVEDATAQLAQKKVTLTPDWPGHVPAPTAPADATATAHEETDEWSDPFLLTLPTILIANKIDQGVDPGDIDVLNELLGTDYPTLGISTVTGEGLDKLGPMIFEGLRIIRVYTKAPGKQPDYDRPFTVFHGDTVHKVARLVHKEVAEQLKFARVWGSGQFDGQQVGADYQVADRDVVELHTR